MHFPKFRNSQSFVVAVLLMQKGLPGMGWVEQLLLSWLGPVPLLLFFSLLTNVRSSVK